jgi:hypothetical protein
MRSRDLSVGGSRAERGGAAWGAGGRGGLGVLAQPGVDLVELFVVLGAGEAGAGVEGELAGAFAVGCLLGR